jgi:formamidase
MKSCGGRGHYDEKGIDMERTLGIGTCQIDTVPGEFDRNIQALKNSIEAILFKKPWVRLVCAHELCIQGIPDMQAVAQEIPGEITRACAELAKKYGIYLIPGTLYEKRDGRIFNTAPVFDPKGDMITTYSKLYPWRPQETTSAGTDTVVFDIPGSCRVGLCICLDIWYPEVMRDLVWKGAEVIFIPTATGTPDRRLEIILAQASAITNQCYIVSVNGSGKWSNGQSLIVDPEGVILQQTGQLCENMTAMLDLARIDTVRNYGTYGVTHPLAGFFHEQHRFGYQQQDYSDSPIFSSMKKF